MARSYTVEEKDRLVAEITKLREEKQISLHEACKIVAPKWKSTAKALYSMYSWWRARQNGKEYAARKRLKPKATPERVANLAQAISAAVEKESGRGEPSHMPVVPSRVPAGGGGLLDRIARLERIMGQIQSVLGIDEEEQTSLQR